MTKILLIEDDATINELIQEFLQDKGCCCTPAYSGTEGRLLVDMEKFELILLDLMIPGMSGQDLLEYIRAGLQTPVIVLSARTALEDKVELLGMGADDYLTKPFELEELWARIQVQLRRTQGIRPSGKSVLKYKDWTINLQERSFIANKLPVELTSHEMGILELLIKHPKKVFTKHPDGEIRIFQTLNPAQITSVLSEVGISVYAVYPHQQDLEGYFMELMGQDTQDSLS